MRKHILFVLIVTLVALLAACGEKSPAGPGLEVVSDPSASPLPQINLDGKETPPPEATPTPLILSPEELLSAAEAAGLVGYPVTASFDALATSQTGEAAGNYEYDMPHEGIDTADTAYAWMILIQNGLISPSELEKGHDAEWAFEEFRNAIPDKIVDLAGLGAKAYYVNDNGNVHVLFQDYYILAAFIAHDGAEASLALNKAIAAFIVDKISQSDVTLVTPD